MQRTHIEARHWPTQLVPALLVGIWAAIVMLGLFGYLAINAFFESYTSCAELWDRIYETETADESLKAVNDLDRSGCSPWS